MLKHIVMFGLIALPSQAAVVQPKCALVAEVVMHQEGKVLLETVEAKPDQCAEIGVQTWIDADQEFTNDEGCGQKIKLQGSKKGLASLHEGEVYTFEYEKFESVGPDGLVCSATWKQVNNSEGVR